MPASSSSSVPPCKLARCQTATGCHPPHSLRLPRSSQPLPCRSAFGSFASMLSCTFPCVLLAPDLVACLRFPLFLQPHPSVAAEAAAAATRSLAAMVPLAHQLHAPSPSPHSQPLTCRSTQLTVHCMLACRFSLLPLAYFLLVTGLLSSFPACIPLPAHLLGGSGREQGGAVGAAWAVAAWCGEGGRWDDARQAVTAACVPPACPADHATPSRTQRP
ncbi:unnamed protein product [Closterium sp. NIES-65]|nr:unnamed protein product [Closterium sp. NIES-65]